MAFEREGLKISKIMPQNFFLVRLGEKSALNRLTDYYTINRSFQLNGYSFNCNRRH